MYSTLIEKTYIQQLPFLKSHDIVESTNENDILITSRDISSSSRIVSVKPRNFEIAQKYTCESIRDLNFRD